MGRRLKGEGENEKEKGKIIEKLGGDEIKD